MPGPPNRIVHLVTHGNSKPRRDAKRLIFERKSPGRGRPFLPASQNAEQLCSQLSEIASAWPGLSSEIRREPSLSCEEVDSLVAGSRGRCSGLLSGSRVHHFSDATESSIRHIHIWCHSEEHKTELFLGYSCMLVLKPKPPPSCLSIMPPRELVDLPAKSLPGRSKLARLLSLSCTIHGSSVRRFPVTVPAYHQVHLRSCRQSRVELHPRGRAD